MRTMTIIIILLSACFCYPQFAGGDGSENSPWQITTASELNSVHNYSGMAHSNKYFIVMNDIDLKSYLNGSGYNSGAFWRPIGMWKDESTPYYFYGKFNGNGKKITGLKINRESTYDIGLFSYLGSGGIIENLGVEIDVNGYVKGDYNVGGLVGVNYGGLIFNCYSKGDVCGGSGTIGNEGNNIGGLVGNNQPDGIIQNCYADCIVTGRQSVGGLLGLNFGSLVENCYTTGTTSGLKDVGGLVGYVGSSRTVQNCYSLSNVVRSSGSETYFGGFVGRNYRGKILNCYSTGSVKYGTTLQTNKGFCGYVDGGSGYQMTGNFWDKTTSGSASTSGNATGKTTEEMKLPTTFIDANWDFESIWDIKDPSTAAYSYPYLINNQQEPIPGLVQTFAGGTGEGNAPWQIMNAEQLSSVRAFIGNTHNDKYFVLINDIDLAPYLLPGEDGYNDGAFWQPIGDNTDQFHGKFNGDGYKVSYLKVNREATDYIGLFGVIGSSGKVENLGVEVVTSTLVDGNNYVGSLVGCNYGTLENIYGIGEGTIKGNQDVGGLAGRNEGTIKTSYSTSMIEGLHNVGGFVGNNNTATIENCFSKSDVTRASGTNTSFGAFCGNNDNSTIKFSYCTGSVSYEFPTFPSDKGFVGNSSESSYLGNFFDNQISNQSTATGATGKTTTEMTNSTSTDNIYLNAGWDFKGESNNGTQNIWNIGNGRNNNYPYQSIFYPDDPPSVNTIQSTQSLPSGNSNPDPIVFAGTGVTIDFSGVSGATGADDITISKYNEAPANTTGAIGSEVNIAGTSYLFTNNSGFTFTSTVQFLVSDIPGVNTALFADLNNGDATDIKFWKRPEYGSGEFTNLGFLLYNKGADNINGTADDYLYLEGVTSFSEFTFSSGSHPLPVELTSFTASVVESKIILNWQTATEVDNYGFEIERALSNSEANLRGLDMINDDANLEGYTSVGFVAGHGNSNSTKEYSFTDDLSECHSLTLYYRLKQIDTDGKFSYSNEIQVEIDNIPGKFALEQNYPNPFNPATVISYQLPAFSKVTLKVYDILGNEVVTLVNEIKTPGNYEVEWNAAGLASGVYFYKLKAGEFTSVKKLILLR